MTVLKLLGVLVVAGVLAAGVLLPYVGGVGLVARSGTDKFLNTTCDLQEQALEQKTSLYARDGKTLIAQLFADNRNVVPLTQIPKLTQRALIDTEDRRFYSHHGVDPRGLLRAALHESGGNTQGASTLTQQYVKQIRFYQAKTKAEQQAAIDQTLDRKVYEAKCALKLERQYSKDDILAKYFNIAFFGQQAYGIEVAAQTYFGKPASKLTVPESATLVGLVKDPTLYDPFQHPKPAMDRRNEVIQNMVTAKDITQAQADAYKRSPIGLATKEAPVARRGCAYANDKLIANVGFFCDYAVDWLENTGGLSQQTLERGGLKIITSIDPTLQNTTQKSVFGGLPANAPSTAIMPQVDPKTGAVLAMATSKKYNYGDAHGKDPAYTSVPVFTRPSSGTGSTYKYFTLLAALQAGVSEAQTLRTAGSFPARYFPKYCNEDTTNPANGIANAGQYQATLSLRDAMVQSSNTFFVGVEDQIFGCDLSTIVKMAEDLGITSLNAPADPQNPKGPTVGQATIAGPSYTFTIGQTATSPLELTAAYAAAANDGTFCPANPITAVTDTNGRPVQYQKPACRHVFSAWTARTAINIMQGDTHHNGGTAGNQFDGFYRALGSDTHDVAGKTGTNNASYQSGPQKGKDDGTNAALWFVGLTPRLVATTAVYDVANPTKTVQLPGYTSTNDVFGAYSAAIWTAALQPMLAKTSWTWPSVNDLPNVTPIPNIAGQQEQQAVDMLKGAGFKPVKYPITCNGSTFPGSVAYAGPPVAAPGATVIYCMSGANQLSQPVPPMQGPPPAPTPPPFPPYPSPPPYTLPPFTPPSYTPPSYTPPSYTPPSYTPPPVQTTQSAQAPPPAPPPSSTPAPPAPPPSSTPARPAPPPSSTPAPPAPPQSSKPSRPAPPPSSTASRPVHRRRGGH